MNLSKKTMFPTLLLLTFFTQSQAATYEYDTDFFQNTSPKWEEMKEFIHNSQQKHKDNYQQVLRYIEGSNLLKAKTLLDRFLKESPNESGLYNLQALIQLLNKDDKAAKQSYLQAIELDPTNIVSYIGLARLNIQEDSIGTAERYIDKALAIDANDVRALLIKANILYKQGKKGQAEDALLEAYKYNLADAELEVRILNVLGKFYVDINQPEKMLPLSLEVVKRYPNNIKLLLLLAGAQISNKQQDSAEATLRKIISFDDKNVSYRLLLVRVIGSMSNREQEVLSVIDSVLAIDEKNKKALVLKATLLTKIRKYKQALNVAGLITQFYPNEVLGKVLAADVYMAENQLEKAFDLYQQAYKKEASNKILDQMRKIMIHQNNYNRAVVFLQQALEKDNKNTFVRFHLASLYQQLHKDDLAEMHYKIVIKEQAKNYLALNNLAWLMMLKNDSSAIKLAERAYAISPQNSSIVDTYGYILVKLGDRKKGLSLLQEAMVMSPEENGIKLHLAEAYEANNETAQAVKILNDMVKTSDSKQKKEALELLKKLANKI